MLADVGFYLVCIGELERGAAMIRKALALTPHPPAWYHQGMAVYHYAKNEDVAALGTYQMNDWLRGLVGYRMVEGGAADGGKVYAFAWLHYVALGLQVGHP